MGLPLRLRALEGPGVQSTRMNGLADYDVVELEGVLAGWGHKPSHARRLLREFYDANVVFDVDRVEVGAALGERLRLEMVVLR